jgi:dynein heavy chain
MMNYDKDNISQSIITQLQPYVNNEDFTPENVERKGTKATKAFCLWVCNLK